MGGHKTGHTLVLLVRDFCSHAPLRMPSFLLLNLPYPFFLPVQMVQGGHKPVLVVKGARVGDFNGKTLSTVGSSTIMVDPHDVEQAGTLRNW